MTDTYYTKIRTDDSLPENEFRVVINTDAVDQHGTVIDPDGLDVREFLGNPVLLFQHRIQDLSVGRVLSLSRTLKGWEAHVRIDGVTELERVLIKKLNAGSLNAASIGFIARKSQPEKNHTRISDALLKEISIVTIGSNPEALVTARSLAEAHMKEKDMDLDDNEEQRSPSLSDEAKELIMAAKDALQAVLDAVDDADEDSDEEADDEQEDSDADEEDNADDADDAESPDEEEEEDDEAEERGAMLARMLGDFTEGLEELQSAVRQLAEGADVDVHCKSKQEDEEFLDQVLDDLSKFKNRDGSLEDIDLDDLAF